MQSVSDPEADYYQSIEEFFVSRRGDPLFLSNADWTLIRKWRTSGVPLRVVLRGVRDALDSHAHSWGRRRKVGSLAYCASEVDAAVERWQRALTLGSEGPDVGGFLRDTAERLDAVARDHASVRDLVAEMSAVLRARAEEAVDTRVLEEWLAGRETALVLALGALVPEGERAALEAEIDAGLAPYAARMPAKVLAQVRTQSHARRILERFGLPRLSLFHL